MKFKTETQYLAELSQAWDLVDRYKSKCEEYQSKLAAIESQEPVGLVKTVGGYPDESDHTVKWLVKHRQISEGQPLYAKPVPADKPLRITEQDAREIIELWQGEIILDKSFKFWLARQKGRDLLNKLNADRQVSAEPDAINWNAQCKCGHRWYAECPTENCPVCSPDREQMPEVAVAVYDLSPANVEGKIRDSLITMGWTPPGSTAVAVPESYITLAEKLIIKVCCVAVERLNKVAPDQDWDSGEVVAEIYIRELRAMLEAAPSHSQQSAKSGYAGVTVWVGDKTCTQIVSRLVIETSSADELLMRFENARYLISQSDHSPSHDSEPIKEFNPHPNYATDCAVAAIEYALENDEPVAFLRLWMQGEFDALRKEWDNIPDAVFIGADVLFKPAPDSEGGSCD